MKHNDTFDNLLRGFLLNKNLKLSTSIAAIRILYNFFSDLDLKKDSTLMKKELKKQIKKQPISALTFSFLIGLTLAGLVRRIRH